MEDPFEKPLPTRDEHLRWSLADVAPAILRAGRANRERFLRYLAGYSDPTMPDTPEQVLAGAALGSCSGTAWFAVLSEMGSALEALDTWLGQDARLPFVLFVFVVGGAAVVESVERRFPRLLDRATAKFAEARQQLEARRD